MDIGTGLALFGSAKIIEKLLGPTADYIGEGVKTLAEKRIHNIRKIFDIATQRLGNKINDKGSVPPKILKCILEEGSFCNDSLSAEYFGGVLASSRSEISRDDRGSALINLISCLSTYQIRTHYIFYHMIKSTFNGEDININSSAGRNKMEIYIPFSSYLTAMDFGEKEKVGVIVPHIAFGLDKEKLIEAWRYGPKDDITKYFNKAQDDGLILKPSVLGVELFLWSYGKGDLPINNFLNSEINFELSKEISIVPGFQRTK